MNKKECIHERFEILKEFSGNYYNTLINFIDYIVYSHEDKGKKENSNEVK